MNEHRGTLRGSWAMENPIIYLHVTLQPWGTFAETIPQDHSTMGYVVQGSARFCEQGRGARDRESGDLVLLRRDGDEVSVTAGHLGADVLLLAGTPLGETVVQYDPFVMNTTEEIRQAMADYQSGRFGQIVPTKG